MEAWGRFFFFFPLREVKTSRPTKISLELPYSKNGAEYNHFISHATSQYIGKDQSPRGGGEHGSLMGCTVLCSYLKRLKPPKIVRSSVLITQDPPSIMLHVALLALHSPKTEHSSSRGPRTHTPHEPHFNPLQPPIESQSRKITEETAHCITAKDTETETNEGEMFFCVFVNVCSTILRDILSCPCHSISKQTGLFLKENSPHPNRLPHFKQTRSRGWGDHSLLSCRASDFLGSLRSCEFWVSKQYRSEWL